MSFSVFQLFKLPIIQTKFLSPLKVRITGSLLDVRKFPDSHDELEQNANFHKLYYVVLLIWCYNNYTKEKILKYYF